MSTYVPEHARTANPHRTRRHDGRESARRPDAAPAPALRGVDLTYPDGTAADGTPRVVRALDGVDFTARTGEVTALVGDSGSGKSSLLSVAATLIRPDRGQVLVAGEDAGTLDEAGRARLRREEVGVVFQQPNLLASLTAAEQLLLTEHLRGVRGRALRAQRERVEHLLERVGMAGMGERRVHQLSGGQRQRINIARALMGSPSVLLADEPTSALDHQRSREVMGLLRRLTAEDGLATVVVTHDTDLLDLADRTATMRDGRLTEGKRDAADA